MTPKEQFEHAQEMWENGDITNMQFIIASQEYRYFLEQSLEPKTCDGCVYCYSENVYTGYCGYLDNDITKKFGCLAWESKGK